MTFIFLYIAKIVKCAYKFNYRESTSENKQKKKKKKISNFYFQNGVINFLEILEADSIKRRKRIIKKNKRFLRFKRIIA